MWRWPLGRIHGGQMLAKVQEKVKNQLKESGDLVYLCFSALWSSSIKDFYLSTPLNIVATVSLHNQLSAFGGCRRHRLVEDVAQLFSRLLLSRNLFTSCSLCSHFLGRCEALLKQDSCSTWKVDLNKTNIIISGLSGSPDRRDVNSNIRRASPSVCVNWKAMIHGSRAGCRGSSSSPLSVINKTTFVPPQMSEDFRGACTMIVEVKSSRWFN